MKTWQLQEAKARLSELVKQAKDGPQAITVHGRQEAVVLSGEAYGKLLGKKPSLRQLLAGSGLDALTIGRDRTPARQVRL